MKTYFFSSKICYFLFFLFAITTSAYSQISRFETHIFNPKMVNPAFTGFEEKTILTGIYSKDYIPLRYGGRQHDIYIGAETFFKKANSGLAINYQKNTIGSTRQTQLSLFYSYKLKLNENNSLTLAQGIGPGFLEVEYDDYDYYHAHILNTYSIMGYTGLVFKSKGFFAGLGYSGYNLYRQNNSSSNLYGNSKGFNDLDRGQQFGYNVYIGNEFSGDKLKYTPSVLLATPTIDFSQFLLLSFNNKFIYNDFLIVALQPSLHKYQTFNFGNYGSGFNTNFSAGISLKDRFQFVAALNTYFYSTRRGFDPALNKLEFITNVKF